MLPPALRRQEGGEDGGEDGAYPKVRVPVRRSFSGASRASQNMRTPRRAPLDAQPGGAVGELPHPQAVDDHQPSLSPDAASLASCGTTKDRATMCENVAQRYRSSARTLHSWDYNSLWVQGVYH